MVDGTTLYVGNPPYLRHHMLTANGSSGSRPRRNGLDMAASQLAGLHVHFFVATVLQAKAGDFGSFITAAEWLDVNYGGWCASCFERTGRPADVIEPQRGRSPTLPLPG